MSERDDWNQSEVIDLPAALTFFRVLVLLALGGEKTIDGGGRLRGEDVIAGQDTDGLVTVLAIKIEELGFDEMKEYIPDGSAVSERVSEGWMTCPRRTSVDELFRHSARCFQSQSMCRLRYTLNV